MKIRGMSGKWNAMWHSSPSPKYGRTSSGHWFASARSIRPGKRSSTNCRSRFRMTWVPGRFSQLVPSCSTRYGTASSRNASTPSSAQKARTPSISSSTAGFSKLRSGWWLKKRCQ